MKITIDGFNSQFVKVNIDGKKLSVRVGDVIHVPVCPINSLNVVKVCQFCGREYDKAEYEKTMSEQAPSRDPAHLAFHSTKTCGLYCGWMMNERFCNSTLSEERLEKMKEDVASRVAKYLEKGKHLCGASSVEVSEEEIIFRDGYGNKTVIDVINGNLRSERE